MKAIIFDTQDEADTWNNGVAISKGCRGVTNYWYPTREMKNGNIAVLVGNDEYENKTVVELTKQDFPQADI